MICQWMRLDRAILRHLQADGRLSNVELAERVRLSPSPCLRRVRALEAAGAIRGYHADIDPEHVGRGFEVLVHVDLALKDRTTVERFEAALAEFDGGRRVPAHVRPPRLPDPRRGLGPGRVRGLLHEQLAELPGLARVNSQFTMKAVKRDRGVPIVGPG